MMTALDGKTIAAQVEEKVPGSVSASAGGSLTVRSRVLPAVAAFLKEAPALRFDYLNAVTAADYYEYFEIVYHLTSLEHQHTVTLKTRCYGRDNPAVPSVAGLWRGADFQEREIYDLMGIRFEGHPNLRRIFLWEGFDGYPLRKDYLK